MYSGLVLNVNCNFRSDNNTFGTHYNCGFCDIQGVLFKMVIVILISIVTFAMIVNILHDKSNVKYEEYKAELVREKAKRID